MGHIQVSSGGGHTDADANNQDNPKSLDHLSTSRKSHTLLPAYSRIQKYSSPNTTLTHIYIYKYTFIIFADFPLAPNAPHTFSLLLWSFCSVTRLHTFSLLSESVVRASSDLLFFSGIYLLCFRYMHYTHIIYTYIYTCLCIRSIVYLYLYAFRRALRDHQWRWIADEDELVVLFLNWIWAVEALLTKEIGFRFCGFRDRNGGGRRCWEENHDWSMRDGKEGEKWSRGSSCSTTLFIFIFIYFLSF